MSKCCGDMYCRKENCFNINKSSFNAIQTIINSNVLVNNNVLVISFDEYGILKEKIFYNKENMKDYKFSKVETDNSIKKGSFVTSFLQSLRQKMRANAPK